MARESDDGSGLLTDWNVSGLSVVEGEFVTTTADGTGAPIYQPLTKLLERIRRTLGVDVVFVSQFLDGRRLIRYASADDNDPWGVRAGLSDPLEESYCYHVAQGRLPEVIPDTASEPLAQSIPGTAKARVASHVSAPIIGRDGAVYGTVCCFNHATMQLLEAASHHKVLKAVAELIASVVPPPVARRAGVA